MRKSLLFIGASVGLLCSPFSAYSAIGKGSKVKQALAAANRKAAAMNAETVARFFHPATIVNEQYDSYDKVWGNPTTVKFTYNTAGQVLTESTSDTMVKYTYDNDGRLVKQETYQEIEGESRLLYSNEYTYDSIVKDLVIKEVNTNYDIITGQADRSSANGAEITRNSDGNIVKIQEYSEWNGERYLYDSMLIEYGADKKAVKISELYDGEVDTVLSDIVWETTDGQIFTFEYDDPDGEMYFSNNRIASAIITDEHYPCPVSFSATYDGDSYHSKIMAGGERALEINFNCIQKFAYRDDFDDQYSYDCTLFEAEYEYDEDTDSYYIETTRDRSIENRADAFGINILNKTVTTYKYPSPQHQYDDETEVDEEKYEVTYDETYGYPVTAVSYRTSWETGELEPSSRYTYSDYLNVDPSGVALPVVDGSDDVEYFTLQGIRVIGQPTHGIYICRKGSQTSKVIIK